MLAILKESEPEFDPEIAPLELLAEVIECVPVIKSVEVLSSFQFILAQKIHERAMVELKIAKLNCPGIDCDLETLEAREANNKRTYFQLADLYQKIAFISYFKIEEAYPALKQLKARTIELSELYRAEHRELDVYRKSARVEQSKRRVEALHDEEWVKL